MAPRLHHPGCMSAPPTSPILPKRRPSPPPLTLAYQPIVSLADGSLTAVEALTRLRLPVLRDVSPARFVSWSETAGFGRLHTSWVLRRACSQIAGWQQAGRPFRLSVNVSARDLAHRRFAADVSAALLHSGLLPSSLQLEITETGFIEAGVAFRERLMRLRNLGVRISIDDFGTGYSALQAILEIPADEIKLDRCFIERLDVSAKRRAIVESAIELAHKLGMEVIAEGVETEAQRALLRAAGCDAIQGFLISPALPLDQLCEKMRLRPHRSPQTARTPAPAMALAG